MCGCAWWQSCCLKKQRCACNICQRVATGACEPIDNDGSPRCQEDIIRMKVTMTQRFPVWQLHQVVLHSLLISFHHIIGSFKSVFNLLPLGGKLDFWRRRLQLLDWCPTVMDLRMQFA